LVVEWRIIAGKLANIDFQPAVVDRKGRIAGYNRETFKNSLKNL